VRTVILPYKFQVRASEYSLEDCGETCVDGYAFPIHKDGKDTGLFLYLRLPMQDDEEPVCEIRDDDEVQYVKLHKLYGDDLIDEWLDSLDLPSIMESVEATKSSMIKGTVEDGNFKAVYSLNETKLTVNLTQQLRGNIIVAKKFEGVVKYDPMISREDLQDVLAEYAKKIIAMEKSSFEERRAKRTKLQEAQMDDRAEMDE
jgi:hypothetical protein